MRRSLSFVVRQSGTRTAQAGAETSRSRKYTGLYLVAGLILVSTLLAACSNPFGGAQATPTPSMRALSKIDWCTKKPLMVFRDENALTPTPSPTTTATATATSSPAAGPGTPTTITSWSVVKANLGFETYLPTTLPNGTCLVSVCSPGSLLASLWHGVMLRQDTPILPWNRPQRRIASRNSRIVSPSRTWNPSSACIRRPSSGSA